MIEELRGRERRLAALLESLRGEIRIVADRVRLLDRTLELRVLALEQAERERRRPG